MVPLDSLTPEQMMQIRAQLDQEVQQLTPSLAALSSARGSYLASKESLAILDSDEILVPLTSSLYVPGRLTKKDTVTVDVGTGYFVEKSPYDAKVYFNTKVLELGKKIDELQQTISTKRENQQMLESVLQVKLANQQSATPAPDVTTASS